MGMIRLTAAQALVRYLAAQQGELDGADVPLFAGVWAIFGHGNVAALGEALHTYRDILPTFRAHNEQAMGHAAIAFAKASRRRPKPGKLGYHGHPAESYERRTLARRSAAVSAVHGQNARVTDDGLFDEFFEGQAETTK